MVRLPLPGLLSLPPSLPLSVSPSLRHSFSPSLPLALLAVVLGLVVGLAVVLTNPLYLAAGLAGVALGLALLASTHLTLLAFVAVATLLPFGVIPVRLGFQLTLVDALLTLLLVVWLLRTLARAEPIELTPVGGLVLAYLGVVAAAFLLGSASHFDPDLARRVLKLLNSILFFFSAANCLRHRWQVEQAVRALVVGGFLAAAIGVALHVQPRDTIVRLLSALRPIGYPSGPEVLRFLPAAGDTYSDTLRATSTSVDPNVLGGLLMVTLALLVSQAAARRPLLPRLALAPMGLVMLACLVLTYSRSAWVGLAAAVAYLGTFRYRRAWLFGFLAIAVLLYLPIGQEMLERLEHGLSGRDKATMMRFSEYRNALAIIQRSPVLGIGFGEAPSIDLYPGVSSLYLLIAEQTGLVGLALVLATVAGLLVRSLRALLGARDSEADGLLIGLQATMVAALVAGLFDHYFANPVFPHMVALFWLLLALLWRTSELALRPAGPGQPRPGDSRYASQGDVQRQ